MSQKKRRRKGSGREALPGSGLINKGEEK